MPVLVKTGKNVSVHVKQLARMSEAWVCLSVCGKKGCEDKTSSNLETSLKCKSILRVGNTSNYLQHVRRGLWESSHKLHEEYGTCREGFS